MNGPTTHSPHYLVDVAELRDEQDSLIFTFVPKSQGENGIWVNRRWVSSQNPVNQFTLKAWNDAAGIKVEWSRTSDDPGAAKVEIEAEVAARLNDRAAWIERMTALVSELESWANDMGWSTHRIEKSLDDSWIGKHHVLALLLQQDLCRIMLEPIGPSAPGAEGVVDLYLMPAYDDIATLFFYDNRWNLHSAFQSKKAAAPIRDAESRPLSKETLKAVLDGMRQNAA